MEQRKHQLMVNLKKFNDAFHKAIIALERLEAYVEVERLEGGLPILRTTAALTSKDKHNEEKGPIKSQLVNELLQSCLAISILQDKWYGNMDINDKKNWKKINASKITLERAISFFLNDVFAWYGGRFVDYPLNETDAFFYPILIALTSKDFYNDLEKNKILADAWKNYTTTLQVSSSTNKEIVEMGFRKWQDFRKEISHLGPGTYSVLRIEDMDIKFNNHGRGMAKVGYKRLQSAFGTLFSDAEPSKYLLETAQKYTPDIIE